MPRYNSKPAPSLSQTDLGVIFGMKSIEMGKVLTKLGLRENLTPSKKALDGGYAIPMGYAPNTNRPFWVWDTAKTGQFLVDNGYQNLESFTPPPIRKKKVKKTINTFQVGDVIVVPPGTPYSDEDRKNHGQGQTDAWMDIELVKVWGSAEEVVEPRAAKMIPWLLFHDDEGRERTVIVTKNICRVNQRSSQSVSFYPV